VISQPRGELVFVSLIVGLPRPQDGTQMRSKEGVVHRSTELIEEDVTGLESIDGMISSK